MSSIKITVGDIEIMAQCLETPTAQAIVNKLPFSSTAQTWGEEVYFYVPVEATLEPDARDVVELGDIAFWVEGGAIAIGFGPTPISQGDEIRLAAKTNVWAKATNDLKRLKSVTAGMNVKVEPA